MPSVLDRYPLRIVVGGNDLTQVTDEGTTWSNVDPGGFEACSIPIARDCPEISVGMPIRIESGTATAWEGLVSEIQRSLGNRTQITGAGYGQYLKTNTCSFIWVDRDLTRWAQPSLNRQKAIVVANLQQQSFQVGPDFASGVAISLIEQIANTWTAPWDPTVEAWYDAGPENLATEVWYDLTTDPGTGVAANFVQRVLSSSDDVLSTSSQTANLNPGVGGEASGYYNPGASRRFMVLRHTNTGTAAAAGVVQGGQYNAYWKNAAVYGPHGLTGRGSDPVGFYPSDIVKHALTLLPAGLITGGLIPDYTSYTVPHYVQYVPVTVEQVISDMAAVAGVHWGTWESLAPLTGDQTPRLDFTPYPTTPTCFCTRADCDSLDINEQLANLYDSAQVTYTNVAGVQQAVLVTIDNPYLDAVGLHNTLVIDAGTNAQAGASAFGTLILVLAMLQARAGGSATFTGLVNTVQGQTAPWLLRAGQDRLRVTDLPGQDAFGQTQNGQFAVSRVEANVSADGIQTSVELGSGPNLIEVLQARMQAISTLSGVA